MRTSKYIILNLILVVTVLFSGCEVQREGCTDPEAKNYDVAADEDDGSCVYGIDPINEGCYPDLEGNLSITNLTNEILLLYNNFAYITCIPANAEGFVVNIPNQNLSVCLLQIWKANDVEITLEPDINIVYRQWSVALSNTTEINERATWLITGADSYAGSGTLELTYPEIDDYGQEVIYQVDVFLNSKEGAKIASLQPGVSGKKVSIDYGIHYLYFRFWYSDPNSTSGDITEIGWDQKKDIVINAEHETAQITIPFYYSNVGKYGEIRVYNETDKIISIYANDALIETIAKVEGSSQGLSIIPAQDYTTFLIPVNTYTISAKSIDGSSTVITFKGVEILKDETAIKRVGIAHQTISLTNQTGETLMLYTTDEEYLGVALIAGENSGNVLVPADIDTLMVMNGDKSKSKKFAAGTGIIINELDNYIAESFDITMPWSIVGENQYLSPDIADKASTEMQAVAVLSDNSELSFEYKVSSEAGYDFFYFSVDGIYYISKESGEVDWTNFNITLTPGTHNLRWLYEKDDMFTEGTDNVGIRNISLN